MGNPLHPYFRCLYGRGKTKHIKVDMIDLIYIDHGVYLKYPSVCSSTERQFTDTPHSLCTRSPYVYVIYVHNNVFECISYWMT